MAPSANYALQATGSLSHLPTDWVAIAAFLVIIIAVSLRAGTRLAAALALALPITTVVLAMLPGTAFVPNVTGHFFVQSGQLVLFAAVFVVFYILVFRMIGSPTGSGAFPMEALLAGLAATAVVLVFWLQIPALSGLWHFGPQVQAVFSEKLRLLWLVGAYTALAFVRR